MSSNSNSSTNSYSADQVGEIAKTIDKGVVGAYSVNPQSNITASLAGREITEADTKYFQTEINLIKVAKLANLTLTKEEERKFADQLTETLKFVENLNEVDTENIEPMHSVTGLSNVMRSDETEPSLSQEDVLKNAKSTDNGQFKVKAIFDAS